MQPLCLPAPLDPLPANAKAIGWGAQEDGSSADVLMEVRLPMVDVVTCNTTWNGKLDDSNVSHLSFRIRIILSSLIIFDINHIE